jgi:hypothetical protein
MTAQIDEATLNRMIEEAVQVRLGPAVEAELAARGAPAPVASGSSTHIAGGIKLESPPEFAGTLPGLSPTAWLFKVSSYFNATGVTDDATRIAVASYRLTGPALSWWRTIEPLPDTASSKPKTWGEFCTALTGTFSDAIPVEHARDRLAALQQRTSVRQYAYIFRNTAIEIPNIANEELKDRFIRGLKPAVRQEVRMRNPSTFEDAVQMAERYDSLRYGASYSTSYPKQPSHFFGNKGHEGPAPMDLGAMTDARQRWNGKASGNQPSGNNGLNGKLTPELKQKLIKEGRCFYCRETGHRALACPKRKQQSSK